MVAGVLAYETRCCTHVDSTLEEALERALLRRGLHLLEGHSTWPALPTQVAHADREDPTERCRGLVPHDRPKNAKRIFVPSAATRAIVRTASRPTQIPVAARHPTPLHHMEHAVELLDVIDGAALLRPGRLG